MTEPVSWLKAKYSSPKQKGRYHSSHNDQGGKKRTKIGSKTKPTQQRVLTITATGKHSWSWRAV